MVRNYIYGSRSLMNKAAGMNNKISNILSSCFIRKGYVQNIYICVCVCHLKSNTVRLKTKNVIKLTWMGVPIVASKIVANKKR